jgi:hypothetical protein
MMSIKRLCLANRCDCSFEPGMRSHFLGPRAAIIMLPFIDNSANFLLAIPQLTFERFADIADHRAASFAASEGRFRETADSISIFSMEYNIIFCVMPHIYRIILLSNATDEREGPRTTPEAASTDTSNPRSRLLLTILAGSPSSSARLSASERCRRCGLPRPTGRCSVGRGACFRRDEVARATARGTKLAGDREGAGCSAVDGG